MAADDAGELEEIANFGKLRRTRVAKIYDTIPAYSVLYR